MSKSSTKKRTLTTDVDLTVTFEQYSVVFTSRHGEKFPLKPARPLPTAGGLAVLDEAIAGFFDRDEPTVCQALALLDKCQEREPLVYVLGKATELVKAVPARFRSHCEALTEAYYSKVDKKIFPRISKKYQAVHTLVRCRCLEPKVLAREFTESEISRKKSCIPCDLPSTSSDEPVSQDSEESTNEIDYEESPEFENMAEEQPVNVPQNIAGAIGYRPAIGPRPGTENDNVIELKEQPKTPPTDIFKIYSNLAANGKLPGKKSVEFYLTQGATISKAIKSNRLKGLKKISLPFTNVAGHSDIFTIHIDENQPAGELALTKNRLFAVMHLTNFYMGYGAVSALATRLNWETMEAAFRDLFRPLAGAGFQFMGKFLLENHLVNYTAEAKSEWMFTYVALSNALDYVSFSGWLKSNNTQEYARFVEVVDLITWISGGHDFEALSVEFHSVTDGCTRNLSILASPDYLTLITGDRATEILNSIVVMASGVIADRRGKLNKRLRDIANTIIAGRVDRNIENLD